MAQSNITYFAMPFIFPSPLISAVLGFHFTQPHFLPGDSLLQTAPLG